ncbi:tRNA N6-adenosine threonylcarbamoyltransferase [Candidatus Anstonella stagnisolia]|nr:tRNA N6-adenosine threonylcarbamoyltransferase [Candidatus Anstonella stagnisolia]
MICLGIESTAHTIGVGVSNGKKVLSNDKGMYKPVKEGIVPRKAAEHHAQVVGEVLERAISKAGVSLSEIDVFSFSQGPGLGACLKIGAGASVYLSQKFGKPLVGVNHCHAHLEISRFLLKMKDPLYVYVSGGNTQIIVGKKGGLPFSVLGETLDIGVGNLFDSLARELEFEYAHGSEVAKLAARGKYFELPYTVKGMNFAFSGLLTAAVREKEKKSAEDICKSVMDTAFAEVCEASERALLMSKKKELIVCGGVAQNAQLCAHLKEMCEENSVKFGVALNEFNADNGGMIAHTGMMNYLKDKKGLKEVRINQYWRIDEV